MNGCVTWKPRGFPRQKLRRITQDDYDKKARELKEQQAEIATRIEQHQQGNAEYRTTLESLISLASRAAELFERSKTEQKMVDRRSYTSWLAFLNTVRTERFEQVLALRPSLLAIATAAQG